jgi:hypothetical protein
MRAHRTAWLIKRGGFLLAAVGLVLFFAQCIAWLQRGFWQSITLQWLWVVLKIPWPELGYARIQRIIDRTLENLLQLPLAFLLILIGIGITLAADALSGGSEKRLSAKD